MVITEREDPPLGVTALARMASCPAVIEAKTLPPSPLPPPPSFPSWIIAAWCEK
jgi:hypothetical protein